MIVGLYHPGTSVLHRMPAGTKLAVLILAGAGSLLVDNPVQTMTAMAVVLAGYAIGGVPARLLLDSVRPLWWVLAPLVAFQALVAGWQRALVITGVIATLALLADLVTLTTRTSELIDVVVRQTRHLAFLGADPDRIGVLLNVAIRSVPLVVDLAGDVKQAQEARGLALSPRAFAVPLIVGALRRADALGDALAARGFDDDPAGDPGRIGPRRV